MTKRVIKDSNELNAIRELSGELLMRYEPAEQDKRELG